MKDKEGEEQSTLGDSLKSVSKDELLIFGLFVAAIVLYTSGLGNLPLRDWDEGIVAGVARNIWRASSNYTWLYPTINYDAPYWNKPPLIHWLIAISYSLFGVSEWSTRIVPALLSAASVPLLYLIGREIFAAKLPALFSALVYLTLLPIARHGRVAMLDGAIACWFCLAVWCLLRGRRSPLWLLGTGFALGLVCLTKGMMMGVLFGGIILIFVAWDSRRLLRSVYLWGGLVLGIIPAIAWYGLQYLHYGEEFLSTNLGTQTFSRIWEPVSSVSSPPWYYLLEIAKYSLPWLIFLPYGIKIAIGHRNTSWAKLALVWNGVYLLAISLMVTKLPWYVIPIYPGLSLLVGISLAKAWKHNRSFYFWRFSMSLVAMICWLGGAYYSLIVVSSEANIASILILLAVGFTLATLLLWLRSPYFIPVTIVSFYLALLLLFNSTYWLWELNEAFAVKPAAAMLEQYVPPRKNIYTNYPNFRPSLDFYSDRVVIPASDEQLQQYWQQKPIYLFVDVEAIERLNLAPHKSLAVLDDAQWQLITQSDRQ